jgi:hypothetical protein
MHQFAKHFTLAEARALLPQLRELFARLHKYRAAARQADEQLGAHLEKTGGDAGGPLLAGMLENLAALNTEARTLQGLGVVVKDFDRGLVDFPTVREGREVFLCWELDEDDIEFWHDLDAGYAGRERL